MNYQLTPGRLIMRDIVKDARAGPSIIAAPDEGESVEEIVEELKIMNLNFKNSQERFSKDCSYYYLYGVNISWFILRAFFILKGELSCRKKSLICRIQQRVE